MARGAEEIIDCEGEGCKRDKKIATRGSSGKYRMGEGVYGLSRKGRAVGGIGLFFSVCTMFSTLSLGAGRSAWCLKRVCGLSNYVNTEEQRLRATVPTERKTGSAATRSGGFQSV
ncbi:hypothetical protein CDAR_234531 [Caerostris darwini]|uniref:Transmembrane protein n=1 Tax=Caerostris darwini TaxID=1538125 RepID=A0AAV4TIN0_9ARAC|nr:hypothetical protein CDAR_234531 [Caerostris darwini]